jgi:serine protease inhibitor
MFCKCAERLMWVAVAVAAFTVGTCAARAQGSIMAERLASAQTVLASRLIEKLATNNTAANIMISPASLAGALGVIEFGANDRFRRNLHRVLGFSDRSTLSMDFDALRRATSRRRGEGPLESANAILFDRDSNPHPAALDALMQSGVRASVEDFVKPETLTAINQWVSEQTKGKIPTILDRMPSETGLVALNALYFKDRWKQPFEASETKSAPFHLVGGKAVDVPLMRASDRTYRYRQDARFVAVELPYASEGYSLVLVSTHQDPAAADEFAPVTRWLTGKDFASAPGEVALPKFDASASLDLMPSLKALGLRPPTTLPGFSRGQLRLAKAQQRVELSIDEEGTEAAAATAVTATRSFEGQFIKFTADKPFMFALRDESGLIVLAGYIGNPRKAAPKTSEVQTVQ